MIRPPIFRRPASLGNITFIACSFNFGKAGGGAFAFAKHFGSERWQAISVCGMTIKLENRIKPYENLLTSFYNRSTIEEK
jgi:hypothetical protein